MNVGWEVFKTVADFVRFSDAKAAVILAFAGGSAAFLSTRVDVLHAIILRHGNDPWGALLYVAVLLYLCALAFTMFASLRSLRPALSTGDKKRSLIFFKHIAEDYAGRHVEYGRALGALGEDEVREEVAHQICANARIATAKFEWVERAIQALIAAIAAWAMIVVLLLLLGGEGAGGR